MDKNEALKSITITAAEAVDLEDRIGSIDAGKDADLVLLDGEPFEILTSIEKVFIDGKIEFQSKKNTINTSEIPMTNPNIELMVPEKMDNLQKYAVKGGTIFTMAGNILKNGTIFVEQGKIKKIGKNLSIPKEIPVIDAGEFVLLPGLISSRSYVGIGSNWRRQSSINETSNPIVPAMEVKHAVEPQVPQFSFFRELGITTAMVTPGNRNVIGGRGVILKTDGDVVDKMVIEDRAVMVFGIGRSAKRSNSMPTTRMGIAALLRETLTKAQEYQMKWEKYNEEKKGDEPKKDLDMEAMLPALKGEIPVLIHCERKDDILTALRITDEFGLKVILDGATDAYKITSALKKRNIPVIIENLFRGAGNIEDKGFNPKTPAILSKAGIKIGFRSSEGSWTTPGAGSPGGDLLEIAAFAVKNGMSEEAALRAVTIGAAEIIGVEHRVGSLEPGKDADILILRGHPLRIQSIPEALIVNGKLVYKRDKDAHLK